MIKCDDCGVAPKTNDEQFYHLRLTDTGRDFDTNMKDLILCKACLLIRVTTPLKISMMQSVVRIENPVMA